MNVEVYMTCCGWSNNFLKNVQWVFILFACLSCTGLYYIGVHANVWILSSVVLISSALVLSVNH